MDITSEELKAQGFKLEFTSALGTYWQKTVKPHIYLIVKQGVLRVYDKNRDALLDMGAADLHKIRSASNFFAIEENKYPTITIGAGQ